MYKYIGSEKMRLVRGMSNCGGVEIEDYRSTDKQASPSLPSSFPFYIFLNSAGEN